MVGSNIYFLQVNLVYTANTAFKTFNSMTFPFSFLKLLPVQKLAKPKMSKNNFL